MAKGRKLVGNSGNDKIYTPDALATAIVHKLDPVGWVLEPCAGGGAFCRALKAQGIRFEWCELDRGIDFLQTATSKSQWVITNPPFSLISKFLEHTIRLGIPNIAFLCTVNAIWMNGKLNTLSDNGYQLQEVLLVESPYFRRLNDWPQSGFSLGVLVIRFVGVGHSAVCPTLSVTNLHW